MCNDGCYLSVVCPGLCARVVRASGGAVGGVYWAVCAAVLVRAWLWWCVLAFPPSPIPFTIPFLKMAQIGTFCGCTRDTSLEHTNEKQIEI